MSKEQGYNGWANYETWLVKLWIDSDQSTYSYFNEEAQNYKSETDTRALFAERIESMVTEDYLPQLNGLAADLMNASLSKVNWYEIAESILGDAE